MSRALQFAWDSGEKFGWDRIGSHLLLAMGASLVLLWPIARMIVGPQHVFIRAVLFVGSMIALTAAFAALGHFVASSDSILFMAALGLVYFAIVLAQARHIFAASRGAAAGVIGCFVVLTAGASYCAEMLTGAMPWSTFAFKSQEERNVLFAEWRNTKQAPSPQPSAAATAAAAATPAPNPAAPANSPAPDAKNPALSAPAPATPPRSGPDLDALYAQLQKTRAELDMNDAEAVARFNQQAAAYAQERALAATASVPRAVAVKTEPAPTAAGAPKTKK